MNAPEDFLFNEKRTKCNFLIADLDIDILSEDAQKHEYFNVVMQCAYISLINNPTRVTALSVRCLDHSFMRSDGPIEESTIPFVYRAEITDLSAVGIQTVFGLGKTVSSARNSWIRKNINYKDLKKNLSLESWNSLEYMENAEELMILLQGHIAVCTRTMLIPKKQRKKTELDNTKFGQSNP
ncbi:hypothetical protein HHI36_013248 [Cryptolaemus montrouzieri]|uniref:Uncharacterized protein n=1 Tax=Cryptolaemus montrouzieri TaxID=559131 RepID=A0ABD2NHM6_9CUCU